MFNITDVEAGWLTLHINDDEFVCSYLTDVEYELRKILELLNNDVCRIEFEGEGPMLYLTCFMEPYRDVLHIIWEQYGKGVIPHIKHIETPYNLFCDSIVDWFNNNRKYYHDNFGYEHDD